MYVTAAAVAAKVKSGTITSSPVPISNVANARCKAVVPLFVTTPPFVPIHLANLSSNLFTKSPLALIQPLLTAS